MKTLKGNEDFLCINQCVNIFDIISCKEEQASQIIAWLLNPREAHGFKEQVFIALLNAISADNKNVQGYKNGKSIDIPIKNILRNYQNAIIQTEYAIKIQNSGLSESDKRIDILLCIENNDKDKYLIVIENKYGSKEHGNQTAEYFKYFNEKHKDYQCIYIYMDICDYYIGEDKISSNQKDDIWNITNYDWLIYFLKSNMNRRTPVDNILKDIYIEFSGDYEEEGYFSAFYNQKQKLLQSTVKQPLNKYKIGEKNQDIEAYNYSTFYKVLKESAVYEDFLKIRNDVFKLDGKEYVCDMKRKQMYFIPKDILDNWAKNRYKGKAKVHWPISCVLSYDDDVLTAKIEIWDTNLNCYTNKGDLTEEFKKCCEFKKNIIITQDITIGNHEKGLIKFINNNTRLFDIIRKGKY